MIKQTKQQIAQPNFPNWKCDYNDNFFSTSSESIIILYCGIQMSILVFSVVNIKILGKKWDFEELKIWTFWKWDND